MMLKLLCNRVFDVKKPSKILHLYSSLSGRHFITLPKYVKLYTSDFIFLTAMQMSLDWSTMNSFFCIKTIIALTAVCHAGK